MNRGLIKDRKFKGLTLEERNAIIRQKFEDEAHERERLSILELKNNYEAWITENSIRTMM